VTDPLALLKAMTYPGRIVIIGQSPGGERAVIVYAVTGRSPASRARELRLERGAVRALPTDEEVLKKGNASLLVYPAIAFGRGIAVSNGRQTEAILNQIGEKTDPQEILSLALKDWSYEPDEPHFTPRISGCLLPDGNACLSLIKRGPEGLAQKRYFAWRLHPGKGRLLATYSGPEENPLPSFSGDPLDVEVKENTAELMAESVFTALRPQNQEKDYRVALACAYANISNLRKYVVHIINKNQRQA
jgi:IMP cyclohydrolase